METLTMGAESFRPYGRTESLDEANSHLSNFANTPKTVYGVSPHSNQYSAEANLALVFFNMHY